MTSRTFAAQSVSFALTGPYGPRMTSPNFKRASRLNQTDIRAVNWDLRGLKLNQSMKSEIQNQEILILSSCLLVLRLNFTTFIRIARILCAKTLKYAFSPFSSWPQVCCIFLDHCKRIGEWKQRKPREKVGWLSMELLSRGLARGALPKGVAYL